MESVCRAFWCALFTGNDGDAMYMYDIVKIRLSPNLQTFNEKQHIIASFLFPLQCNTDIAV